MELAFATTGLRRLCEDLEFASKMLGTQVSNDLIDRIADLRAAESLSDVVARRPRACPSQVNFAIGLVENHRILLRSNHQGDSQTESSAVQLDKVWRVKITDIGVHP